MRIFFFIIFFIIINSNIYYQNDCSLYVNGKVLDSKTKEPLSSVLIQIDKFQKFAITDEEGNFVLDNLCSYIFNSIITRVGYYDSIFQINKKKGGKMKKEAIMTYSIVFILFMILLRLPSTLAQEKQIRADVVVSNVEVPVRGMYKGNPVDNLQKKAFKIFENGKELSITGFNLLHKKITSHNLESE